jgi:hypothetical protein
VIVGVIETRDHAAATEINSSIGSKLLRKVIIANGNDSTGNNGHR